jgi:hypothetical protein
MNPNIRRAFHQAIDIILDAIAEGDTLAPKKSRRRGPAQPPAPVETDASPELKAKVRASLERAGYRPTRRVKPARFVVRGDD